MGDGVFYRRLDTRGGLGTALKKLLSNRRVVLALVLGVPLALFVVFGNRGVVQRVRLQAQKAELQRKILDAEAEAKRLQQESRALDGDRKTIEKVAREKYGMVREGETVYRVARSR
jgi:cell division protein FtsB